MAYEPPSIGDIAVEIATCLAEDDEASARRLGFHFVEVFDRAAPKDRSLLVRDRPPSTGDARFDAFLAGIVEYVCARHDDPAPRWVDDADRFVEPWWFVSGMRSLHANAIVHSPASLKRHGVFVSEGSLSYR